MDPDTALFLTAHRLARFARKLGRHSVGIELSGQYAEMAKRRLNEYAPLFR